MTDPIREILTTPLLLGSAGGAIGVLVLLGLMRRFLLICRPNEILIVSGRKHATEDGNKIGYRVIAGGRAWRIPILEAVSRMDIRSIAVEVQVQGAYTRVGIPLKVRAIAMVKIVSYNDRPERTRNAIERFLGRGAAEIQQVAKQTLEGNLRGVLATLTPEEVNEDRLAFAKSLSNDVEQDLSKLGLHLDVLKIQHVADDANYLDSIGRGKIAAVVRDAEIAESNARNEAAKVVADAEMRAKVAEAEAEQAIALKRNEVRRLAADLEAQAKSLEERADAAGLAARATAEQALQTVRRKLEEARLEADVVVPAELQREAALLGAAGAAASVAENGRAAAEALEAVAQAWRQAGPHAQEMIVLHKLEEITRTVVAAVRRIDLGPVHLIDDGSGTALPRFAAAYPEAVAEVMRALRATTGLDVTRFLTGGTPTDGVPAKEVAR